ncbi:MAG: asparagine synthase (glutamine-hydrolyzing) [Elusimicrobia bacterium]|nr:asparagine synthase (glutamine-hydrolyzing) [Elusimicrobiota bacterium]
MCGIAGELSFGAPANAAALRAMADALVHRGPDDQGLHCEGRLGLAHRRLSILDLSPAGRQPMWSEDKALAIVFNGEVYNYREIRPELEAAGYRFAGGTDTEVVLNAVHRWGLEAALERFIGMFAFALWDARAQALTLVRDRLGVKPLYYQKTAKGLLFGSELKALYAHPDFRRELLPKGLEQFFRFGYTLGEATVYKNSFKLPAGHCLRVEADGGARLWRYWSLDGVERGSYSGTFARAVEELSTLCDSAFSYRLVSDVPVGVFLSGGVDSSFLAAFLKRRAGADLEHITIGFDEPAYDESPKARRVARDLDLRHTVRTLSAVQAQEALLRFVEIWDEPFGDASGIPTSMVCALARERVKVVLSADGGDELFCGYESYPAYEARYRRLSRFPAPLRSILSAALRRLPYRSLISAALALREGSRWNPQTAARYEKMLDLLPVRGHDDLIRISNEKGWTARSVGDILGTGNGGFARGAEFGQTSRDGERGLIDRMMRADLSAFLGEDILCKVDRASMAVGLECRDPFLDHRLVEFAFSLPLDYLYENGTHKRVLKAAVSPWISQAVLNSPKRGFSIPLYDWLRGPWKPLALDYLSPDSIRRVGILDERAARRELDSFYKYRGGRAEKVMLMLNFQMWAERWLR